MAFERDFQATAVATGYPVGTAPVLVAPANTARAELTLSPAGFAYAGVASNFTGSAGLPVPSGALFTETLHTGDVYAKSEGATLVVTRWETSY